MIEYKIVEFLNHLQLGFFSTVLDFLTRNLVIAVIIVLYFSALLIFDRQNGKKVVFVGILAIIITFIINDLFLKRGLSLIGLERMRPYLAHSDLRPLGVRYSDSAFPSGHVATTTALMTIIIFYYRKYWPLAVFILLLVSFERIFAAMHYPTDVLGGIVFGFVYALLALLLAKKINPSLLKK